MKEGKSNQLNYNDISESEKGRLKERILSSVEKLKKRRLRIRYSIGMAASIALIAGFSLFINQDTPESISDFVKSSGKFNVNDSKEVVLIINDSVNVNVVSETATIKYSATGEKVSVGKGNAVNQNTSRGDKIVYNTILVPYGKRSEIELSDGTHVWLNAGSRLVYPAVFKGKKREVYLEGEAIFEVTHNKEHPFLVLSESQEITVLGTVFNVSNYLDDSLAKTVLKSGSVQINFYNDSLSETERKLKITPGTLASYDKSGGKVASKKVNVDHYFSWREGVLIFKNDDLRTIMRRLSRYYNIDIEINNENLAKETFSGYLDLKEDVEKAIGTIQETTEFQYNKESNTKIKITN